MLFFRALGAGKHKVDDLLQITDTSTEQMQNKFEFYHYDADLLYKTITFVLSDQVRIIPPTKKVNNPKLND